MRAAAALIVVLGCSSKDERAAAPPELAACNAGEGSACFVVGVRYQREDGDAHLDRAIAAWTSGCERGHGPSCGQLGTIVEFGMSGRKANPEVAMSFYRRGCDGGDAMSCKRLGIAATPAFDWNAALHDAIGAKPGELGPLFAGWVPGALLPDAARPAIAAWEKRFHAKVRVDVVDPALRGSTPELSVQFDDSTLAQALIARWGKPTVDSTWIDDQHRLTVFAGSDGRRSTISWLPYKSVDELVRPSDPTRLGFEPVPLVGAKFARVQSALAATHVFRDGEADYSWNDYGTGPIEIHVVAPHGTIRRAQVHVITNSPQLTKEFVAALTTKWGPPKTSGTTLVWKHGARRCTVERPAENAGYLDLVLD